VEHITFRERAILPRENTSREILLLGGEKSQGRILPGEILLLEEE